MSSFPTYAIGVILIIFGSLGNNLGNNLVSLAYEQQREIETKKKKEKKGGEVNDEPLDPTITKATEGESMNTQIGSVNGDESNKPKHKDYRVLGTVIFVLGNILTFGSFGFGAQSLLASLESIQFVSNLFFAKYVHNSVVSLRMIIATLSIVGGNIMVVIFASHSAVLFTSNQMMNLYAKNTIYHVYLVVAFLMYVGTTYTYLRYYNSRVVLKHPLLWNHSFVEPFCYACSSSIIGTQAVLKSKCMALLIQVTLTGQQNEFATWYIYFILAIWLLLVSYWLNRLDKGLMLYPPLFIIPVMQVFFVFFAIICGGLYFEEFLTFSITQFIGFSIGVTMILTGVYGLAPLDMVLTLPAEHAEEEEDSKDNKVVSDLEAPGPSSLVILSSIAHSMHSLPNFSIDSPSLSPRHRPVYPEVTQPAADNHDDDDKETEWEIKSKAKATIKAMNPMRSSGQDAYAVVSPSADCDLESLSSIPHSARMSTTSKE
eukprot:gene22746-31033_t